MYKKYTILYNKTENENEATGVVGNYIPSEEIKMPDILRNKFPILKEIDTNKKNDIFKDLQSKIKDKYDFDIDLKEYEIFYISFDSSGKFFVIEIGNNKEDICEFTLNNNLEIINIEPYLRNEETNEYKFFKSDSN